ncbi:MAG: hypothetical protein ACLR0U_04610 [Enterocloster clostridioformis]
MLFFQMRRSIGACEKYLPWGAHGTTQGMSIHGCSGKCRPWGRSWRHCQMLPWGARTAAKAAIGGGLG